MKYKGVIFDLDGTLLNTIEDISASMDYALEKYNFSKYTLNEYKYFVGSGVNALINRALKRYNYTEDDFNNVKEAYMSYYSLHQNDKTRPYDGIIDLLKHLKKMRIKMAVLSNKPHLDTIRVIEKYFGLDMFDVVFGQVEGVKIKPDPAGVNNILNMFKLPKYEVLYIGDSDVDMMTALNAGLESIGVLWGFRTKQELIDSKAKFLAFSPMDILHIIEGTYENKSI